MLFHSFVSWHTLVPDSNMPFLLHIFPLQLVFLENFSFGKKKLILEKGKKREMEREEGHGERETSM